MLQNIKVDVLYYRTATDFEMEFNLGGCCRMRTFTDKTDSRKGLVSMLARAVSRSRVIIISGPLFGDKGLINTVATAVGRTLVAADNEAFGILCDEKIEIIDGSMPLVTTEGFFGGCILESGPQTIVLLTENKSIRKNIMKHLIHPYITEISYSTVHEDEHYEAKPAFTPPMVEVGTEQETEVAPDKTPAEISEEMQETAEEGNAMADISAENTAVADVKEIEFDFEDKAAEDDAERKNTKKEKDLIQEEPEDPFEKFGGETPKERNGSSVNVIIILMVVFLLLVIGVIAYLLVVVPIMEGIDISTYIRSLFLSNGT